VNPYDFICHLCGARLRAKKATLFFTVCVALGVIIGVTGEFMYPEMWTFSEMIIFQAIAIAVSTWIWHFYIWKTDTFYAKDAA